MREWLRTSRKEKGFTAAEMGKELGISESYYCMIENGERQKKMDITLYSSVSLLIVLYSIRLHRYNFSLAEQPEHDIYENESILTVSNDGSKILMFDHVTNKIVVQEV